MLAIGDLPKAMSALSPMPEELKFAGLRLAAEAHYHGCVFDAAIDVWKRILPKEEDRLWRLRTLCRMLESYRLLRDAPNAQACVDAMLTHYQHEPETLFALGYELWQMDKKDDAIHALRRAKDLAAPNLSKWVAWELGRVLFDAEKNLAATDEYVSIADKNVDSVQGREFAVALFRAGLLPAAYERAKAIREAHGEVVPGITEIETDWLVRDQRLQEAKELLQALSHHRPLSVLNRMAVVRICASLNQEEEARAELSKILELELTDELKEEAERFAADLDIVIGLKSRMSGS
jgi:tetratricopeptide (TPR) repeat protein